MVNFYDVYSARYFISTFSQGAPRNYSEPANLNFFSSNEVVSLIFPNFSKFRDSVLYNFSFAQTNSAVFTILGPSTKVVVPITHFYAGIPYDLVWFVLFKRLSTFSKSKPLTLVPCIKLSFLPLFVVRIISFYSCFHKFFLSTRLSCKI